MKAQLCILISSFFSPNSSVFWYTNNILSVTVSVPCRCRAKSNIKSFTSLHSIKPKYLNLKRKSKQNSHQFSIFFFFFLGQSIMRTKYYYSTIFSLDKFSQSSSSVYCRKLSSKGALVSAGASCSPSSWSSWLILTGLTGVEVW